MTMSGREGLVLAVVVLVLVVVVLWSLLAAAGEADRRDDVDRRILSELDRHEPDR